MGNRSSRPSSTSALARSDRQLHDAATKGDVAKIARLVNSRADVNAMDALQRTPLLHAAENGHTEAIRKLVAKGANVNLRDHDQRAPVHYAAWNGLVEALEYLADHGARLHVVDGGGWTPVFYAATGGHADALRYLVDKGAHVNVRNNTGKTPLHYAAQYGRADAIRFLVENGANMHATDEDGHAALDFAISNSNSVFRDDQYQAVRVLCELGAVPNGKFRNSFLRVRETSNASYVGQRAESRWQAGLFTCALHWIDQKKRGEPLAEVQEEIIRGGEGSVKLFLASLKASAPSEIIRRRKICVVGASGAGKTSMVMSMHLKSCHLVDEDDRTIGIDLFPLEFNGTDATPANPSKYKVTFWDFAGQDIYQVAHSLFFSKRTLYMLCVDIAKYANVVESDRTTQSCERASWMHANLFRWVHLILARQPDAEFVLVCTKTDMLSDRRVAELVHEMDAELKQWIAAYRELLDDSPDSMATLKSVNDFETRKKLCVNVKSDQALKRLRYHVRGEVTRVKERAFVMPALYTRVLEAVEAMRRDAPPADHIAKRVQALVMPSQTLVETLTTKIQDLSERDCRTILRTLHDLGDILWYDHRIGDSILTGEDTIIVDPLLVLHAVREVVNHTHLADGRDTCAVPLHDGLITHSRLETCAMWQALINQSHGQELVLFFKQLLQYFNLAYPAGNAELKWDSDLIVPTYWRAHPLTEDVAALVSEPTQDPTFVHRACWQYTLPAHVSETVFDQFVVQSYERDVERRVAADLFSVSVQGKFAMTVRRTTGGGGVKKSSSLTRLDTVQINIFSESAEVCWQRMEWFVLAMEEVLRGYPGVPSIGRHIIRAGVGGKEDRVDVARIMRSKGGDGCCHVSLTIFRVIREKMIQRSCLAPAG